MSITFKHSSPQDLKQIIQKFINFLGKDKFNQIFSTNQKNVNSQNNQNQHLRQLTDRTFYQTLLSNIQSWDIQSFREVDFQTSQPCILSKISHIHFSNLITLEIQIQEVETIEPIQWIKMPYLKNLSLAENDIVSLQPLAKLNLKYLNRLILTHNPGRKDQIPHLNRLKGVDIKFLCTYFLDEKIKFENGIQLVCDLNTLFKLQSKKLQNPIYGARIISQRSTQKFKQIFNRLKERRR